MFPFIHQFKIETHKEGLKLARWVLGRLAHFLQPWPFWTLFVLALAMFKLVKRFYFDWSLTLKTKSCFICGHDISSLDIISHLCIWYLIYWHDVLSVNMICYHNHVHWSNIAVISARQVPINYWSLSGDRNRLINSWSRVDGS